MTQTTARYTAQPVGILGASIHHDAQDYRRSTKGFTHIVVLFNARTEDEKTVWVETDTDRFGDVMDAILQVKRDEKLWGYEIFETLQVGQYVKAEF